MFSLQVYCIRKKARECHKYVYRTCRDFSNYSAENVAVLLRNVDWTIIDLLNEPNLMWNILYKKAIDVLAIMCPFKNYRQREKITPWMTAEIYRTMRECDRYISLFRVTGCQYYLQLTRLTRNRVNQLVHRAKANYIKNQLNENSRNPKKFWRIIDSIINPSKGMSYETRFYDNNKKEYVANGSEADFLNDYFINIVRNLGIGQTDNECRNVYQTESVFTFVEDMPTLDEPMRIIKAIDISKSSCV